MKKLLILTISLLGSLLICEINLRLFSSEKYISRAWLHEDINISIDKNLIFVKNELKATSYYQYPETKNKLVIVTLGDSFTEGNLVANENNFPSQLQTLLHNENISNEVINLGEGGYGPDQEYFLFQQHLEKGLKPDIVIWSFFPNDVYENQTQAVYDLQADSLTLKNNRFNWIYIREFLHALIPLPATLKQESYLVNHFLSTFERFEYSPVPTELRSDSEREEWALKKIRVQLGLINQLAEKNDFEVYLVLVNPQDFYLQHSEEISAFSWMHHSYSQLIDVLSQEKNFINLNFDYIAVKDPDISQVLGSSTDYAHTLFDDGQRDPLPYGNRHFNEKGNLIFAEIIKNTIIKNASSSEQAIISP